ncbi:FtsW/RodA/SpoVE family cell cycle protein, partial [Halalkalibacterium halodurans]
LFRGVVIGTRCKSPFGSLLAFGIVFQLAVQVVFNIGAVTGLLPITGIPLPLVSNGGSSLLVTLMSLAILANISRNNIRQRRKEEQGEEEALHAS